MLPEQEAWCSYCSDGGAVTPECRRKLRARGGAAANDGGAAVFDSGGELLAANLPVGDQGRRARWRWGDAATAFIGIEMEERESAAQRRWYWRNSSDAGDEEESSGSSTSILEIWGSESGFSNWGFERGRDEGETTAALRRALTTVDSAAEEGTTKKMSSGENERSRESGLDSVACVFSVCWWRKGLGKLDPPNGFGFN